MRPRKRGGSALLSILLAGALVAVACDREEPAEDPDTDIAVEEAPSLDVTGVALGRSISADNRVVEEIGDFAPRDTVYATVETEGTASGTLAARWTFEDGQVVDEQSRSVSGAQVTEFHLSHPDGWPAGHYEVIISLDGEEVERSGFDVSTGG
jgi:hypothetical protein